MTTTYAQTDNYKLNLYGDNDPADLRDGHNANMVTIDAALKTHSDDIAKNRTNILAVQATANAAAPQATTYTKTESDAALAVKANSADVYTKTESDSTNAAQNSAIVLKANAADVYTKTESDSANAAQNSAIALKANAADVYTKNESDSRFAPINSPKIMVAVGDSYGSSTGLNSWAVNLAGMTGHTLKNYCIGGKGFLSTDDNFGIQVNRAVNDASFNNNDVQLVVIAGSRNDLDSSLALRNASDGAIKAAVSGFPNATILVVPLLWDWKPCGGYWHSNAGDVMASAKKQSNPRVVVVPWAWTWLLGENQYFTGTDIHPNDAGSKIQAWYMYQALQGRYNGRYESTVVKSPNNTGVWTLAITAQGGTISYEFMAVGGITASDLLSFNIPLFAASPSDNTNDGRRWVVAVSNGANDAVKFGIGGVTSTDASTATAQAGWQGYTIKQGTPNGEAGVVFTAAW